jgi:PAS domain S-box-containing protein
MKMSPLDTANSVNGSFVIEMLKDIVRTGSVRFQAEGKTKDGRLIPFELQVSHMKVGNRDLVMAISRDISDR